LPRFKRAVALLRALAVLIDDAADTDPTPHPKGA